MKLKLLPLALIAVTLFSCSSSDDSENDNNVDDPEKSEEQTASCDKVENFVFVEKDGLVSVEFENAVFNDLWKLKKDDNNATGKGYMVWDGAQYLNKPGEGLATYSIKINSPGTYRFMWKSAVKKGNSGSEHNDSWLRFADADDFFGEKEGSTVYPKDTGKTPNPNGSSKDGWFKIYRSGNDLDFKWQASTSDNDSHPVFVTFDKAGVYTMEISARSPGHAIDKFVLFKDTIKQSDAIAEDMKSSEITCKN
ncbi:MULTISPECIES: hypothetical protein [unclassified Cellulophaga]|uniref:hypothetical protein n=1 Tax=unclassified Cellulophaga TaxID=2634405 RepID=UPI0026E3229F|nr:MULTISPECIES: hypothetical protein [unclassified Cellulophaga]MDO6489953.1 hypothetical protein [Cellulophaga sp. 2_MG-2023]MDO6494853.1 hypothetical protein [Cellulophaga sp. 3_MG-2023]